MSDKGNVTKVTKKIINNLNTVGMNTYCIYVSCDGKWVKPTNTLITKQKAYQKKGKKIILYLTAIVDIFLGFLSKATKKIVRNIYCRPEWTNPCTKETAKRDTEKQHNDSRPILQDKCFCCHHRPQSRKRAHTEEYIHRKIFFRKGI